jgi:hypothetical protein
MPMKTTMLMIKWKAQLKVKPLRSKKAPAANTLIIPSMPINASGSPKWIEKGMLLTLVHAEYLHDAFMTRQEAEREQKHDIDRHYDHGNEARAHHRRRHNQGNNHENHCHFANSLQ